MTFTIGNFLRGRDVTGPRPGQIAVDAGLRRLGEVSGGLRADVRHARLRTQRQQVFDLPLCRFIV